MQAEGGLDSPAKADSQELTFHWLYQRVHGLVEHNIYPKAAGWTCSVSRQDPNHPAGRASQFDATFYIGKSAWPEHAGLVRTCADLA